MIQRMNNVLVKHSKVLFGIITILIIISFVWFLTPGADGSLFFSQKSNTAGEVFGKSVSISDLKKAGETYMLVQAPDVYAQNPAAVRHISDNLRELDLFQFAAIAKSAEIQGIAASDAEVKKFIASRPAFQVDGKFSQAAYDAFKQNCLEPMGYTFESFENAVRTMLMIEKFQMSAANGVVVTDDEVAHIAKNAANKVTVREISFSAEDYKKSVKLTDADVKAAYDAAPGKYMSEPVSDALMVYVNVADVKDIPAVTEARIDEQYKAFGSNMTGKDGKPLSEQDAKAQIRAELVKQAGLAAAAQKLNGFYLKAFNELIKMENFTPAMLKAEAENAGFKVAAITKLTAGSPETVVAGKNIIRAISELKEINTFTSPVANKDSFAFALLTARTQPVPLTFDEVKAQIRTQLLDQKANEKAAEAARALRGDVAAGTVSADKLEAAAAKLGGKVAEAKDFVRLKDVTELYAQAKAMQGANPYVMGLLNFVKSELVRPLETKGFISEAKQTGNGICTMFYIADVVPAPEAITDDAKAAVRELYLFNKREQAVQEWYTWLNANTKCFLNLSEEQAQ